MVHVAPSTFLRSAHIDEIFEREHISTRLSIFGRTVFFGGLKSEKYSNQEKHGTNYIRRIRYLSNSTFVSAIFLRNQNNKISCAIEVREGRCPFYQNKGNKFNNKIVITN